MSLTKKILPTLALVILIAIIVVGYIFVNRNKEDNLYLFVPQNANNVLVVSPENIAEDFVALMQRNPTLLDSVTNLKIDLKEIKKSSKPNGLNPLSNVIVYNFIDSTNYTTVVGAVLDVYNYKQFTQYISSSPQNSKTKPYKDGEIITFETDKITLLKKGNNIIALRNLDNKGLTATEIVQQQFDAIFGKNKKTLAETNPNFITFYKEKKHLGIWFNNQSKIMQNVRQLFSIFESFGDKSLTFYAKEKQIDINALIQLKNTDFYTNPTNQTVALNKNEFFKLSIISTPSYIGDIIEKVIPKNQNYIVDYCKGGLCTSIIGYREKPVFVTKAQQHIDPNTFETITKLDTVEFSPLLNVPELMTAITITNPSALLAQLEKDSLAQKKQNYWTIPHPFFIDEKLFLKIDNNILLLGTNTKFESITPEFNTFSLNFDLPKSISCYPPKNALQRIGMSAIPEIKVKSFTITFDRIEANRMYLKGAIEMVDKKHHSLIQLTGEVLKFRGLLKGFI